MHDSDTEDRRALLLSLTNASWTTQAIHAACALNLPDLLGAGTRTLAALAGATGCHAPSLNRLLRALVTLDLCIERDNAEFELSPLGALLRDDAPQSLRAWALLVGGVHWERWGELEQSVRTGASHRLRHGGQDGFDHLQTDPAAAALFNRAMIEVTRRVAADVVRSIDFGRSRLFVDVGGGSGELLATVLAAHPAARGVLFDLPHAIDAADTVLGPSGVADRCERVAGSFFEAVPAGGDTYLLKSVLHNWDDERCVQLLRRCRHAMAPQARLIVVERIVPERLSASASDRAVARSDLNMLVALSGRERTVAQFGALFDAAGLALKRITPTPGEFQVLEVLAREDGSQGARQ
jgi:hypothetical protein